MPVICGLKLEGLISAASFQSLGQVKFGWKYALRVVSWDTGPGFARELVLGMLGLIACLVAVIAIFVVSALQKRSQGQPRRGNPKNVPPASKVVPVADAANLSSESAEPRFEGSMGFWFTLEEARGCLEQLQAIVETYTPRLLASRELPLSEPVGASHLLIPALPPHPGPQPYGMSHHGAEGFCADYLRHLGFRSVTRTDPTQDGGVDVYADEYAVQVKCFSGGLLGIEVVREILGVCSLNGHRPALFVNVALTAPAKALVTTAAVAVLQYDSRSGHVVPQNETGLEMMRAGQVMSEILAKQELAANTLREYKSVFQRALTPEKGAIHAIMPYTKFLHPMARDAWTTLCRLQNRPLTPEAFLDGRTQFVAALNRLVGELRHAWELD